MKPRVKYAVPALIAGFSLILAGRATAQTLTTLHSFTVTPAPLRTNSDGAYPVASLILSGSTLYGTAQTGGSWSNGTVFAINTDGTGFTNLHSFTALNSLYKNSDGASPAAGLILLGNTLYGASTEGGIGGHGTVFALNTDGTGLTTLHSFTGSDGANAQATLILSGSTLYGTAEAGGSSGNGAVFAVNTDGTSFTNLHSFTAISGPYPSTNSDGAFPFAGLVLSDNTLYGTALYGGSWGLGTVFKVNADGTGFTTLHSFTATSGPYPSTNSDGVGPHGGLIVSGNVLYGTAAGGGRSGRGAVFAVNTDSTGFTNLHSFTGSDGANPEARLILAGNILYGTTMNGGSSGKGTVFAVNTDGTGFTTLHSFTAIPPIPGPYTNSDGANPIAGSILSGNTLYGTASKGGGSGNGTVFSLSLPPKLTISHSGPNVIVTWPSDAAGFSLQCTTNLASPIAWTNVSAGPVVVNGQDTVTNPISGTQMFFRLSQ